MEERKIKEQFLAALKAGFPHETTPGQAAAMKGLCDFLTDGNDLSCFILKGYAGTGKTTLVSALVKSLPAIKVKSVLLAPTGRAAKVLSGYAGVPAFTIHKKIYNNRESGEGLPLFSLAANQHTNTLFIVDEASMIGGDQQNEGSMFPRNNLMDDLFEYIYSGSGCKLMLLGDGAQLPPVGSAESPALNEKFIRARYIEKVYCHELTEVVRQSLDSGILYNATRLRSSLQENPLPPVHFSLRGFGDTEKVDGQELQDALYSAHSKFGSEETIVITRSNKRANLYNQAIRARIKYQEEEINGGDLMMVVKNNYSWLPKTSKAGFIANGDIIEVVRVKRIREMHGFRFAECRVRMTDYPDEPELECTLLLDTVYSESPALTRQQNQALLESVMQDYEHLPTKRDRWVAVKKDPFFNALQVKFAYAITCHKAQGGQWPAVFVDQGFIDEENPGTEYRRWLYTAITRATDKLFLVNFREDFFAE